MVPSCFQQRNNARIMRTKAVAHCFEGYRNTTRFVEYEYPFELVLSRAVNVADFTLWQLSKRLSKSTRATRADPGLPKSSLPKYAVLTFFFLTLFAIFSVFDAF